MHNTGSIVNNQEGTLAKNLQKVEIQHLCLNHQNSLQMKERINHEIICGPNSVSHPLHNVTTNKTVAEIQCNGAHHVIGVESPYSNTRESITRQKHVKPARRKVQSSNQTFYTKFLFLCLCSC